MVTSQAHIRKAIFNPYTELLFWGIVVLCVLAYGWSEVNVRQSTDITEKAKGKTIATKAEESQRTAKNNAAVDKPVAYVPTVTQKVATEAPWYDMDGDKLRGTVVSVVGSRVTLNLLNDIRVDGKGVKIQAKSDTIAYGEGTDKVYIDVQEGDQGKVLINVDGQGYRADQQSRIFGSLANLTPGTWCCFIWVRPEGTTETLGLYCISLLKDGIAYN